MVKKGQVTVFIIVGIVILAVFAAILYITNISVTSSIEVEANPIREQVPQEFVGIQEYTEACLDFVSEKALILIGQQGGYLYPATIGDFSLANPTDADGVILDPMFVPYWYYNSEPNGAGAIVLSSLKPELHEADGGPSSIEGQLGSYIEENVESCLQEYAPFREQLYDVEYDHKEAFARVRNGMVDFTLKMPLTAKRGEATTQMETFYVEHDVNLEHLYDVASEITDVQQETNFLEFHTLNVLSTQMGLDEDKFPPKLQVQFAPTRTYQWSTPLLEQKLKTMLNSYISALRVDGTENFVRYEFPNSDFSGMYQQVYDDMILNFVEEDAPSVEGLGINFDFFNWQPYLDLNAGDREITSTDLIIDNPINVVDFGIDLKKYLNTYDISYPVLVSVDDKSALSGRGYTFSFALEPNIINNKPVANTMLAPPKIITAQDSLLCNPAQRNTELINTLVVDQYSKEPVEFVQYAYSVPEYGRCTLGEGDDNGIFEENYPAAYGGKLELKADGYLTQFINLDTAPFVDTSALVGYAVAGVDRVAFDMYKIHTIDVSVKKKQLHKCIKAVNIDHCLSSTSNADDYEACYHDPDVRYCFANSGGLFLGNPDAVVEASGSKSYENEWYFTNALKDPEEQETYSVIMERVSDIGGAKPHMYEAGHTATFSVSGTESTPVDLVPGVYRVTVIGQLTPDETYIIPEDTRCFTSNEDDCQEFESVEMESLITASYSFEDEDTYLEITADDLYGSTHMDFVVLAQNWLSQPAGTVEVSGEHGSYEINARTLEDTYALGEFSIAAQEMKKTGSKLDPIFTSE